DQLSVSRGHDPRAGGQLTLQLIRPPAGVADEDTETYRLLLRLHLGGSLQAFRVADEHPWRDLLMLLLARLRPLRVAVQQDQSGRLAGSADVHREGHGVRLRRPIDDQSK